MNRVRLSRRSFGAGAAAFLAAIVAGCRGPATDSEAAFSEAAAGAPRTGNPGPDPQPTATASVSLTAPAATETPPPAPTPTPQPRTVRLWVDPSLPAPYADLARAAADRIAQLQLSTPTRIELTANRADGNIRIGLSTGSPTSVLVITSEAYAPVASPRLPLHAVSTNQLNGLLGGAITNWDAVGSPSAIAVQPAVIGGIKLDGTAAKAIELDDYDAFVQLVGEKPGLIGLARVDEIDYRVQALAVDGAGLLTADTSPVASRFTRSLVVEGDGLAWDDIRAALADASLGPAKERQAPPVSVTMAGDIIFGRTVHTIMRDRGDFTLPLKLVADELKQADLTIANLECTLSDSITPPTDPRTFSFMSFTACVDGLVMCGINGVSQANNHSMNFGARGMRDTLAALDAKGIKHFGIGENLAAAREPQIFDVKGLRIAYLGYDGITGETDGAGRDYPGTSPLDVDYVVEDVKALKDKADIIIPFIHWGTEYVLTPSEGQRSIARQAIDAGATMVVGSHPHWVQGMETYKGKPIVYSLGNFVFDQEWSRETKQGLIMHLIFRGSRLAGLRFVPVLIEDYHRPRIVDGAEKIEILDRVWESTDILAATARR